MRPANARKAVRAAATDIVLILAEMKNTSASGDSTITHLKPEK